MKKQVIINLAIFVVGGFLGFCIGSPSFPIESLKGDISKVSRYKKQVLGERSRQVLERVQTDSVYRNDLLRVLETLSRNAEEFGVNVALSTQAAQGIEPLSELSSKMAKLKLTAENASNNISAAQSSIEAAKNGEEVDVEQHFNNALVSAMILSEKLTLAQEWTICVHDYLKDKNTEDNELLAFSCDQWVKYGVQNLSFHNDINARLEWAKLGSYGNNEDLQALFNRSQLGMKVVPGPKPPGPQK